LIKFLHHIVIFLALGGVSGCAIKQKAEKSPVSQEQNKAANDLFFQGIQFKNQQKWSQSIEAFDSYLKLNPSEPAAHYEVARMQRERMLSPEEALKHALKAVEKDRNNKWYVLEVARCYNAINKMADAVKWYEMSSELDPQWLLPLYEWSELLSRYEKGAESIDVINKIEKVNGKDENLTEYKFEIYLKLQKKNEAAKELESLALAFPKEAAYTIKAAEFFLQIGMNDRALALLKRNQLDNSAYAHFLQYKIELKNNQNKPTLEILLHLEKSMVSTELDIDKRVKELYPYLYQSHGTEIDNIIKKCIDKTTEIFPEEAKAFSMQGDFLAMLHQDESAIAAYQKTLLLDPSKKVVWSALLSVYENSYTLDPKLWESEAQKAIELFSFTTEFYKSKYKAQYRLGDFSNMIETCNQGLDLLVENDTDKAIFQLDKLFGLLVLNQRAEAQTLSTKMISEINESNKGITIENLYWMSIFFKWEVPGLNDTAESFEKEGKTHRYFLNALNIKRGAALTENDFNKTDYYDSLMGYQYFQDKKDHTAACSFLKILAENLKWNEWIKQLNLPCQ
jgi:tetratricopeptide (TPR) repeat protein